MSTFSLRHRWTGSSADADFTRDAAASAPGKADIQLSGSPDHKGNAHLWNPEDTLGAALVQCHTLTFLALAAKVGVDVRRVDTEVDVILEKVERVPEVTRCELRAHVQIAPGQSIDKAQEMYGKAHRYCFIAQSLKGEVTATATITHAG